MSSSIRLLRDLCGLAAGASGRNPFGFENQTSNPVGRAGLGGFRQISVALSLVLILLSQLGYGMLLNETRPDNEIWDSSFGINHSPTFAPTSASRLKPKGPLANQISFELGQAANT